MKTRIFTLFLLIFSFVAGQKVNASDCVNVIKDRRNVQVGDVKCETYALREVVLRGEILEITTITFKKFQVWAKNVLVRIDDKRDGTYADIFFKVDSWYFAKGWQEEKFIIYVRKPAQKVVYDTMLKDHLTPRDVLPSVVK